MASLSTAGNVHSTCLRVLAARGYTLRIDVDYYESDGELMYMAEKDGFTFAAENPIELLGLTAVYEHVQPEQDRPYWWYVDGADLDDELLEQALERALASLRERDPARWTEKIRAALATAEADPRTSAADRLGISQAALEQVLADSLLRGR
ncbi:hypothetical protein [Enhygromyxa salina]|uniref:Uncharacterized protein n=1 Tax=Enhygromyxa salina TaxID=215803 RepID=A0A2S9YTR4_9BACT|nr:hypothetical protein [Enhygromyxa salina]PRQ08478.1 hypothetical protein ENSA7_17640 [Enhygromyxa salina]